MVLNFQQRFKGLSLLELLLVLVVAAAIFLLVFNRFQSYNREKDIQAARQNINLLLQAVDLYYYQYCKASQTFSVSLIDIYNAGLLPNLAHTSIISSYDTRATLVGYNQSKKPIYQLSAIANMNLPAGSMSLYQGILGASAIEGNKLIWNIMPNYGILTMQSGLETMSAGLRQFKANLINASMTPPDDSCAY